MGFRDSIEGLGVRCGVRELGAGDEAWSGCLGDASKWWCREYREKSGVSVMTEENRGYPYCGSEHSASDTALPVVQAKVGALGLR